MTVVSRSVFDRPRRSNTLRPTTVIPRLNWSGRKRRPELGGLSSLRRVCFHESGPVPGVLDAMDDGDGRKEPNDPKYRGHAIEQGTEILPEPTVPAVP